MIRFENVVKRYVYRGQAKWVLKGINLEFPRGRNIGILGHNGAGKSTLIRLLSGAESPDYGVIHRDLKISWPLGFGGGTTGGMTAYDACLFVARLYGADPETVVEFVHDFAEVGEYFWRPVNSYSSGMKARLNFGLSMAIDFECYLIDETTAVGDSRFRAKCLAAFKERRSRADVVMVSHSERTIRDYCDMGAILDAGQLTLYDDLSEAIRIYKTMVR